MNQVMDVIRNPYNQTIAASTVGIGLAVALTVQSVSHEKEVEDLQAQLDAARAAAPAAPVSDENPRQANLDTAAKLVVADAIAAYESRLNQSECDVYRADPDRLCFTDRTDAAISFFDEYETEMGDKTTNRSGDHMKINQAMTAGGLVIELRYWKDDTDVKNVKDEAEVTSLLSEEHTVILTNEDRTEPVSTTPKAIETLLNDKDTHVTGVENYHSTTGTEDNYSSGGVKGRVSDGKADLIAWGTEPTPTGDPEEFASKMLSDARDSVLNG